MDVCRCFMEVVLVGVSVGVIGLDNDLKIIIVNWFVIILFVMLCDVLIGWMFFDVILELMELLVKLWMNCDVFVEDYIEILWNVEVCYLNV